MQISRIKTAAIVLSFTSLFIGIAIYSFFRRPPLALTKFYALLGNEQGIVHIRQKFNNWMLPDWVLYGLPDLLWMFSFTLLILLIWNFKITKHSAFWIFGTIALGFTYELLQAVHLTPGVFDFKDIGYILTGAFLALLFTIKTKRNA